MLVLDVWRLTADHLSLKEWARVAGTCKALWRMDLNKIDLMDEKLRDEQVAHLVPQIM